MTRWRGVLALVLTLPPASAALGACSSFSEADADNAGVDDGGGDGDAGPGPDATSAGDGPSASDASDAALGPNTLIDDHFESACDGWMIRHGATIMPTQPGANGSAGACRVCAVADDMSGTPPFVDKIIVDPPPGLFVLTASFHEPSEGPAASNGNFLGLQFDDGQPNATSRANPVLLGMTWESANVSFQAPQGTTAVHATIEVHQIGTCLDVDDVKLVVSP